MPEVKRKPRAAGGGEGDVTEDEDTREGPARSGCAGTFYVRAQLFLPPAPLRLPAPTWQGAGHRGRATTSSPGPGRSDTSPRPL